MAGFPFSVSGAPSRQIPAPLGADYPRPFPEAGQSYRHECTFTAKIFIQYWTKCSLQIKAHDSRGLPIFEEWLGAVEKAIERP
jgi:hypothetical protein